MTQTLPVLQLDPRTYNRSLNCVHCGLCLPACPTYTTTGHEADSPRGRIQIMRGLAEGTIDLTEKIRGHLDLCLDCRGCETACPSGVVYHELIEETRAKLAAGQALSVQGRFMRWIFFNIFIHPLRLKMMLVPARIMQKIGVYRLMRMTGIFNLLPMQLRKMEQMLPDRGRLWPKDLPYITNSDGPRKATVGFFSGCIGSVMFDEVNRKAVELLAACGAEIIVSRAQGCCGAIHHHSGEHHPAIGMAKENIEAFEGVDYIATNIAGCGAMLREYDHLLRDDPEWAARAVKFVARVRDISEVLQQLGLPEVKHSVHLTVTYHDACHLAHAQKVTQPPRDLLSQVPGLKLVPLHENDMCCGAAGTYNLTQPEMATNLADRKLNNITATGARICATGNVGCAMHLQGQARTTGRPIKMLHPVEILHQAVFGPSDSTFS